MSLRSLILGSPLPTAQEEHERLSKVQALAVFSSDALSSVAYGTEEILMALIVAGPAALAMAPPIAIAIAVLLVIVASSYYQTVHGYPSGGGAYIVAHDNLGVWPGLTAGAALLIDYVLTVAVSTTAGVAAITSAVPALYSYRVWLCLAAIAIIMWANLRGVRESGTTFAIPTYSFLAISAALLVAGVWRLLDGTLATTGQPLLPSKPGLIEGMTLFLVLRAFASGCSALTGVEAISNGIPAFRKPEADNAGKTLIAMAAILAVLFLGITFLGHTVGIAPEEGQTVMSQLGRAVFGDGGLYITLQAATAMILIVAANTSFADFPRLAAILARDGFLPRQFTNRGDRLVFNNGILMLAILAGALVVIFGGLTHRLIPLYAVGVFLSFTLSQSGMVVHWLRLKDRGWRAKAGLNALGAAVTGVVLAVVVSAKFLQGAWIVTLLIPIFVFFFSEVRRHYRTVAEQLSLAGLEPERWEGLTNDDRLKIVVFVSGIHRGTLTALHFARQLSTDVSAVLVDVEPDVTRRVQERWPIWGQGIPLVVLDSPYRSTLKPALACLEEIDQRDADKGLAVVVLPEFVPARRWHRLLHNHTAQLVRTALLYRREHAGEGRVVINVPYYLQR